MSFDRPAVISLIVLIGIAMPHLAVSAAASRTLVEAGQPEAVSIRDAADKGPLPGRKPPQSAIEACNGKREGDPCSFTGAKGAQYGECLSGSERIFACRPYRKDEAVAEQNREFQSERRDGSLPAATPAVSARPMQPLPPPAPAPAAVPVTGAAPPAETKSPLLQIPPTERSAAPQTAPVVTPAATVVASPVTYLLLTAGVVALVWYRFYRHYTLPLRRLRTVTQKLAAGDLSARVGEGLVDRRNEVADLGRDVDRMAGRIEGLVGSHQRLIRDVSHELRSPLARLNVALELARQSAGPTLAAPFDRIERESERLNELIGQLLMLTRLESDSSVTRKSDLDIASLVAEIVHDVDFEARSNDRSVSLTAAEPLRLKGNQELLRQALENLVRNAARYTEPGTAVEIAVRRKDSGGRGMAHITVHDHGPGVPEAELHDIFRPFYRVSDSRERQSGGTGVGLAISDRAVRLHGGSLRAFNAPGGGLIMEMELPLSD